MGQSRGDDRATTSAILRGVVLLRTCQMPFGSAPCQAVPVASHAAQPHAPVESFRGCHIDGSWVNIIDRIPTLAALLAVLVLFIEPPQVVWQRDLPAYQVLGNGRLVRAIIHMHSVYSHDACDGRPLEGAKINQACLLHMREALCRNHVDALFLTEHTHHVGDVPFNAILNVQPGDEPIWRDDNIIANVQRCQNGHRPMVFPGSEGFASALALLKPPEHPLPDVYNAQRPDQVESLREAGASILLSHAEIPSKSATAIRTIRPDAMEVYNLHANLSSILGAWKSQPLTKIDPPNHERGWRGYWLFARTVWRIALFAANPFPEPDLYFLVFFREDASALRKWGEAVLERPITGVLGTDGHENALPLNMRDGERADGYRRITRWFSNLISVEGEVTRESILTALNAGRVYMAFEIFGTPIGLDFRAETEGRHFAMGATVKRDATSVVSLDLALPALAQYDARERAPALILRLLRASNTGWIEVARANNASLHFETLEAGVYRGVIIIRPNHLLRYLPGAAKLIGYRPWVYTNPIYVP